MTDTHITWADLARLKKAAKAAKTTLPDLSHTQRLDVLATTKYSVRHFHELQKRYEAHIDTHIDKDGRAYHCRFCDFTFDGGLAQDVKAHRERHQQFEEATATLGYLPAQYREREHTKRVGYDWMRSPNEPVQRDGALAVLLACFERSLERAIANGYWPRHPYFDEYVACALPSADFIPEAIRRTLVEEFGECSGVIPLGYTDWPSQAIRETGPSSDVMARADRIRKTVQQVVSNFGAARREA